MLERHYCGRVIRARSSAVPTRRLLAGLAVAGLAIGVTACGGDDDGDTSVPSESVVTTVDSTTPGHDTQADDDSDANEDDGEEVAAGPSYTIVGGDTLSGIAGRAGVPLADLIAVNGWSDGENHTILPGDVITLPEGATVPTPRTTTTAASNSGSGSGSGNSGSGSGNSGSGSGNSGSGSGNSGSGSGNSGSGSGNSGSGNSEGGYRAASPNYTEGDTLVVSSPVVDGDYGAEATSDGTVITFVLGRIVSWETCAEGMTDDEASDACASPPLWEPGEGTSISVAGSDLDEVTVINGFDANNVWSVDGEELARLIAGEAPASDAPDGFQFYNWTYLITVAGGDVVAADQQWHS